MERKMMKIWDINVPTKMLTTKPKKYKVMGMEAYLKQYKHFYGSIIVDTHYKILDGYVIYYTAKQNKITDVPVEIVTKRDRIKHLLKKIKRKVRL